MQPARSPWFIAGQVDPAPVPAWVAQGRPWTPPASTVPVAAPAPPEALPALPDTGVRYSGQRIAVLPEPAPEQSEPEIVVPVFKGWSEQFSLFFCTLIADGRTIRELCALDGMPNRDTIRHWMKKYPEFRNAYEIARMDRAEARADRMDDIVQQVKAGKLHPQVAHVMLQQERWAASKEKPSRYGDKLEVESRSSVTVTHREEAPSIDWATFDPLALEHEP